MCHFRVRLQSRFRRISIDANFGFEAHIARRNPAAIWGLVSELAAVIEIGHKRGQNFNDHFGLGNRILVLAGENGFTATTARSEYTNFVGQTRTRTLEIADAHA